MRERHNITSKISNVEALRSIIIFTGSCSTTPVLLQGSGYLSITRNWKSSQCSWILQSLPGKKVVITFSRFSTEKCCQYVEIRDESSSGPIVANFTGSELPPDVVSCGDKIFLSFHSNLRTTSFGFSASFQSRGSVVFVCVIFDNVYLICISDVR